MTKKNSRLIIEPKEFFRNLVSEAMANKNYPAQDEVEFYLVNLLCNFIEPTKIKTSHGDIDVLDTPLATLLKLALESDHEEQKVIFKALGDASLYISGYFQDYFNRNPGNGYCSVVITPKIIKARAAYLDWFMH